MSRAVLLAVFCMGAMGLTAWADVRMPKVFGDNMVLQRGQAVPVWGWAAPDEKVTVEFAGQKRDAVAGADGTWRLKLESLKASAQPEEFKVSGANSITFSNVVVGEVWFCSGQSNMEWSMNSVDRAPEEIAAANSPLIRFFKVAHAVKFVPQDDVEAKWLETSPATIGDKSGVAYFFGQRLHQALNVPVGLIQSAWGGTRIEPWTPACGFDDLPALVDIKRRVDSANPATALHKELLNGHIEKLQAWIVDARKGAAANQPAMRSPEFPAALAYSADKGSQQQPTVLYNGMVAGLVPYAIKGAIWYQGESNNGEGMLYLEKTKALVNGWRKVWGQGDFPYYLVQIAPYDYGANRVHQLPALWEAQAATPSAIPNTGYTVVNDIGNLKDIHPRNKQAVGLRMANQALNRTYGMREVRWEGPVYKSHAIEGNKMRVNLDFAAGLKTRDGKAPDWFEIAGPDGLYRPATAEIAGESVLLSAEGVAQPIAMRFAWSQLAEPNLVNGLGLPTGAFRCGDAPKLDGALALPELQGFRKIYEIDLPLQGNFSANAPSYTIDESGKAGQFARVAYLLQLKQSDNIQYLCAIMDAFDKDATKLGIPHAKSGIKHQTKVDQLTVRTNVEGVPRLDNSDGGNIEFWSLNYGMQNQLNLPAANGAKYDFDDTPAPGAYGCMQVHSWKDKVTLFAYNNFNGGANCDIGIGNNAIGEHPDYTFMGNGGNYEVRRLTILVK